MCTSVRARRPHSDDSNSQLVELRCGSISTEEMRKSVQREKYVRRNADETAWPMLIAGQWLV